MIIQQKPFKQRLGQTTGGYSLSLRFIYPVAMVMPVENFRRRTFPRYVGRVWAPLASFPPLVKTPRDKRFDLVTDARVTLGLPRRSESLLMYGKEQ